MLSTQSPWKKRQATIELERRRSAKDTYMTPLGMNGETSNPEDMADLQKFMSHFYKTFYTQERRKEFGDILEQYMDVKQHYGSLVPGSISEEEFWQRYTYRCDHDRILRDWERHPERSPKIVEVATPETVAGSVKNLLDNSVTKMKSTINRSNSTPLTRSNNTTPLVDRSSSFQPQPGAARAASPTGSSVKRGLLETPEAVAGSVRNLLDNSVTKMKNNTQKTNAALESFFKTAGENFKTAGQKAAKIGSPRADSSPPSATPRNGGKPFINWNRLKQDFKQELKIFSDK